MTALSLGNASLKPEKSTNYTFGVVLQPIRQVYLGRLVGNTPQRRN
jgi:outer membrane receptor protein involved in Fe transport